MSAAPKIPSWEPSDIIAARWTRGVEAVLGWLVGRQQPYRLTVRYNNDRAPIRYPVLRGTREPAEVRVLKASRVGGGDQSLRLSGYGIQWYWRGSELEVSIVDGLASVAEYDLTLELVE